MTATILPLRPVNRFRAPVLPTHGTRDPARLAPPPSGRAVDFDRHRPLCQTCKTSPCVCDVGTMGGTWIADQIRRAQTQDRLTQIMLAATPPEPEPDRDDGPVVDLAEAFMWLCAIIAAGGVGVWLGRAAVRWWLGL